MGVSWVRTGDEIIFFLPLCTSIDNLLALSRYFPVGSQAKLVTSSRWATIVDLHLPKKEIESCKVLFQSLDFG